MVKKLIIPCSFSGQKYNIDFYIGSPHPENHPIKNQATWLSSNRGGIVDSEVMDAIEKLRELADKNNVSFEDLCFYAINKAERAQLSDESSEQKAQIESSINEFEGKPIEAEKDKEEEEEEEEEEEGKEWEEEEEEKKE
jgi:hypothetical protein